MSFKTNLNSFCSKPKEFVKSLTRSELIIGSINILITLSLFITLMCFESNGKPGYTTWQPYVILLSNLANNVSVLLALHKRYTTYIWGIMACAFLGAIAYDNKVFGTMITYWVLCITSQIFLLFRWKKASKGELTITPKEMEWSHFIFYLFAFIGLGLGFSFIESIPAFAKWWSNTDTPQHGIVLFDALGLFALLGTIYLLWNCYTQVWYCYFFADFAWLAMWAFVIYYNHDNVTAIISSCSTMLALGTMLALNICGMKSWKTENNAKAKIENKK